MKLCLATAAAVIAAATCAPAAHAWNAQFTFSTRSGVPARVEVASPVAVTRLEIVRAGLVVDESFTGEVVLPDLLRGDTANAYHGASGIPVASATYEPAVELNDSACVGRAAFSARRASAAIVLNAGAYEVVPGGSRQLQSAWTFGASFSVTLERPLRSGDVAFALTSTTIGDVEVRHYRGQGVRECPLPQAPPPAAPENAPIAVTPVTPTERETLLSVKGSVAATGSSLRALRLPRLAKRASLTLPFAFPEAGTVKLNLVAKGQTIGTGTKTSAVNGRVGVSLTLTPAGRKLFKRTKKSLKVRLDGTFTATRGGAAHTHGVTVTVKKR